MAIIPLGEELAKRILCEFYKEKPAGQGVPIYDFVGLPTWRGEDIAVGLNFCFKQGWLTEGKDIYLVTDEGYRVKEDLIRDKLLASEPA